MERSYVDEYDCACNCTDNITHLHNLCKITLNHNKLLSTTIRGIDFIFGTHAIQPYKKELLIGFSEIVLVFFFILGISYVAF